MTKPIDPTNNPADTLAEELRARLSRSDAELLGECEVHTYRASGPGGQKRNKTSSAVRLHHQPSKLIAKAEESRSQHQNKAKALRRLREMLAISVRLPPPERITWPENVQVVDRQLKVNPKNPSLCHVLGLVLDVLAASNGRLSDAAEKLGLTSSSLSRFLLKHPKAWIEANRIRAECDLPPLRS